MDSTLLRNRMETFFALLALCVGNSPVTSEFPTQRASDAELWCFLWSADDDRDGHLQPFFTAAHRVSNRKGDMITYRSTDPMVFFNLFSLNPRCVEDVDWYAPTKNYMA